MNTLYNLESCVEEDVLYPALVNVIGQVRNVRRVRRVPEIIQ